MDLVNQQVDQCNHDRVLPDFFGSTFTSEICGKTLGDDVSTGSSTLTSGVDVFA